MDILRNVRNRDIGDVPSCRNFSRGAILMVVNTYSEQFWQALDGLVAQGLLLRSNICYYWVGWY